MTLPWEFCVQCGLVRLDNEATTQSEREIVPRGGVAMILDTSRAPSFRGTIELRHFVLPMRRFALIDDGNFLRCDIICVVPDRETGAPRELHWARFMPRGFSDEEIIEDIYGELRNMIVHELAEAWHVEGRRVKDPHG